MRGLGPALLPAPRLPGTLPWMVAATAFLAIIAVAAALALTRAATRLDAAAVGRVTIEVVDADPARREASVARALAATRRLDTVASAERVGDASIRRLLEPSLGAAALSDLPLPALIDVRLQPGASPQPIDAAIRAVPNATAIHGEAELAPLGKLVATLRRLAAAIVLVATAATFLVATLAARAALEAHAATIATLHALGADDRGLAGLVQRRTARDALSGGAIGFGAALAAIGLVGSRLSAIDADVGLRFGPGGWIALVGTPLLLAGLATLAARIAVLRQLERMP